MAEEIHVGDTGTVVTFTIQDQGTAVDLSGAVTKSAALTAPDGTNDTVALTFTTDGTDGKLDLTSVSGTFDQEGIWSAQVTVADGAGSWKTNVYKFRVFPNLT